MENPCWSGYEAYGFKMKDGKRVPNCVPKKNSSDSRMPYFLQLGSGDGNKKATVVNTQTGKKYSKSPIPLAKAKAQKRILEQKADDPPSNPGSDSRSDRPEKWIQSVVSDKDFKKGAFTAQAKAHGMSSLEFMRQVLKNPEDYSLTTRRRAQFLDNIQS